MTRSNRLNNSHNQAKQVELLRQLSDQVSGMYGRGIQLCGSLECAEFGQDNYITGPLCIPL